MNAKIERVPGTDNLVVERDGYSWRRTRGAWEMLGDSGVWFPCKIHDPAVQRQVDDFECCLRTYTFNEGPGYPKGRKSGESVAEWIQRLQVAELRKGAKNIFMPVTHVNYTPGADRAVQRAREIRAGLTGYNQRVRKHFTV